MPKVSKDRLFALLRLFTLIGALVWLRVRPTSYEANAIYLLLGVFALYSVFLYVMVAAVPSRAQKLYRLVLVLDLVFLSFLIKYTGSVNSEFFVSYYLLISLHTYYYQSMKGGIITALSASALYLLVNFADLPSIHWSYMMIRLIFLLLVALSTGFLSLELRQTHLQLTQSLEREKEVNESLDNKLGQITALYRMSQALEKAETQAEVHKLAVQDTTVLLSSNVVYLMRPNGPWLRFVETSVLSDKDLLNDQDIRLGNGIVGKVFKSGIPIIIDDVQAVPESVAKIVLRKNEIRALICTPILFEGQVLGVLGASRKTPASFTNEDLNLLGVLASMVGSALSRVERYENTHRLAITDGKTNVYNYRYFRALLDTHLTKPGNETISLLMLDLDYFKQVNDSFGHPVGDQVLQYVAATFSSAVRSQDVVARFGGEEFIALLPECSAEEAARVGERIRRRLEGSSAVTTAGEIKITVSIGITTYIKGESVNVFLARVDRALYKSKELGRNKVTYLAS
jgi:diguanylate cyclase (GGDEF)-like protein